MIAKWSTSSMAEQLTFNQQVQGSTPWWITSPFIQHRFSFRVPGRGWYSTPWWITHHSFNIVSASGSPEGDGIRLPGGSLHHSFNIVSASGSPEGDGIRLPGGSLTIHSISFQLQGPRKGMVFDSLVDHFTIHSTSFQLQGPRKGVVLTPWWITHHSFNIDVLICREDHKSRHYIFCYFGREMTIRVLPSSKTKEIIISELFFVHIWVTVFASDISLDRVHSLLINCWR